MRLPLAICALLALAAPPAIARETVEASAPADIAVTLYRDPGRGEGEAMNRNWPRGFAMITETRQVTLPAGESTVRFTGVAEGMVAVSAIVTGLPGGTIEKNRNANLLSPAALVDGTLGNRVTITRTNPATGAAVAESAIIRTRADGGLVLETGEGFEAVRCSGLPERLTFDRVPAGLSAEPVFSVDTRSAAGGAYTVELTYLAWGFDWQANYVATLAEPGADGAEMRLMSWLTLLNDNGQSFENAELLVVAGALNVVSNFEQLSEAPRARALSLTCYPLGSTSAGSDGGFDYPPPPPPPAPPPAMAPMMRSEAIVVTGARVAMKAEEEELGDLKIYRVPEPVTVSAKGLKQVAFLDQENVRARLLYEARCSGWNEGEVSPAAMILATVNDREHGLGMALPMGGVAVFEPSAYGDQLIARENLRDYAEGQDVELEMGDSRQVFAQCTSAGDFDSPEDQPRWKPVKVTLTNANPHRVDVRFVLGRSGQWGLRGLRGTRVKDGEVIMEVQVPANGTRELSGKLRPLR